MNIPAKANEQFFLNFETFFTHYLVALLWTEIDRNQNPIDDNYSIDDISPQALADLKENAQLFFNHNTFIECMQRILNNTSAYSFEQAGHDFALTRNGHGAGYWDRNLGDDGDILTKLCEEFKEVHIYDGDDGKLYVC